jgi:hypothetical protein
MPPLPYELWMRILETLSHEHTSARPAYVNCFVEAIIKRTATEENLVAALPDFELRAWKATRPYYAISSSIRKAAQQVFLSGVLLQTCLAPLEEVPKKRKGKRVPKGMKRNGSNGPFYVPDVLVKTRATKSEDGGELLPTYLPLEVFSELATSTTYKTGPSPFTGQLSQLWKLDMSFHRHVVDLSGDRSLLRNMRKVELLAASPYEELTEEAWEVADRLKKYIEMIWEEMKIDDEEMRVMY